MGSGRLNDAEGKGGYGKVSLTGNKQAVLHTQVWMTFLDALASLAFKLSLSK